MTEQFNFDFTGFIYSINAADSLEPFDSQKFSIDSRIPVTSGSIVEVKEDGEFIRLLATIGPNGEFSLKDTRDIHAIRARVFSRNHTCIDLLFTAGSGQVNFEVERLYTPLFNANQDGVPFVHWQTIAGNGPEYIFREDGFFSIRNNLGNWTTTGKYRTSYSQNARGYHISTQTGFHHVSKKWDSPSTDRTYFIVDAAQILNVWTPRLGGATRWQLQHI